MVGDRTNVVPLASLFLLFVWVGWLVCGFVCLFKVSVQILTVGGIHLVGPASLQLEMIGRPPLSDCWE